MLKYTKKLQVFALILIASALLLAAINPNIASVKAQGQATVDVLISLGGTTDPSGTTTYNDGTAVTLTATAGDGFVFQNWEIATSEGVNVVFDNPAELTVSGGVTYAVSAVFEPVQFISPATSSTTNNAIVVVLAAGGGTTTPAPGTYALANAANLDLTATPNSGWVFSNWIISGTATNTGHGGYPENLTPTDNPYNVNHGYGYTFYYQPVFVPVGSSMASPTPPATGTIGGISTDTIIIALAVVLVIVLVAFGAFAYMKRSKK